MLILATTSNKRILEDMEFMESFNATLAVPQISTREEFKTVLSELKIFDDVSLENVASAFKSPISIKKLIMLAEMARQGSYGGIVDRFHQVMGENL